MMIEYVGVHELQWCVCVLVVKSVRHYSYVLLLLLLVAIV